jgi:type IV pilus assembly protein PilB
MEKRKRLGDILVDSGLVTTNEVETTVRTKGSKKLGEALTEAGLLTEDELLKVLERQLGIPRVHLRSYPIDEKAAKTVTREFAERNQLLILERKGDRLRAAMVDPMDYFVLDDLRLATGFEIEPVIASKKEISDAIETYYNRHVADLQAVSEEPGTADNTIADDESEAPIIRMVNQALITGLKKKASDIHIDPHEKKVVLRCRIDGVMYTERAWSKEHQNAVTARVKIMADLNITETRLPQDGRVKVTLDGTPADLRISTMPTVFGEKIVIRILDMEEAVKEVEELNFSKANAEAFHKLIDRPAGMVLITGPTGSGKTTTLYAALNRRNTEEANVITVEDPVEYQLPGINQVQVKPSIGLSFAKGLRSILRQDPDIIMVGEIRDTETAEIAVRASLTGHLVFSTIHTNSALSTIPRLVDMGVEPYLVMSSLSGIVSQRLVRRICPSCAASYTPTKVEQETLAERKINADRLYKGKGCPQCNETGYKGRMAVHELLVIDDRIRGMVLNQEPHSRVREYLQEKDMLFLMDDGFTKVIKGETTMEEIYRVAADDM